MNSDISDCYAAGQIMIEEGHNLPELGLVNFISVLLDLSAPKIRHCLYDAEVSDLSSDRRAEYTGSSGLGATTIQMMDPQFYSLNGWGGNPHRVIDAGRDYPRLAWEGTPGQSIPEPLLVRFDGKGTLDDPFVIEEAEQLEFLGTASVLWDKTFALGSDLDLKNTSLQPIGRAFGAAFSGTFDGRGHTLHRIEVTTGWETPTAGFFGYVGVEGKVQGLVLDNALLSSSEDYTALGLLAGSNHGLIETCGVEGAVSAPAAAYSVGGLVGENWDTVSQCYASGQISGGMRLGGLVGYQFGNSRLLNSYSTANVSGSTASRSVGGLTGSAFAPIENCYAVGRVTSLVGHGDVGGLVGLVGDWRFDLDAEDFSSAF